jgi:tetratricopeptide (TPR) repeat protein
LADPRGRRELVERIVPPKRPGPKPWILIFQRFAPAAGLAAAAVVGFVSYQQWTLGAAHTGRLLASAYTARRQMEMRVAGAERGPMRTQMGTESTSLSEPRELMAAKLNISRSIEAHPDDPTWLQLEGRMELLDGKEDAAIAELERAHALRPIDSSILLDLGNALFQKAAKEDDPQLRGQAYERFSEGLRLKPEDPVLLFNHALAAESMRAYTRAGDDWKAYLSIDPKSAWAQEAKRHQDEVKKNLTGGGHTPPPQPPKP